MPCHLGPQDTGGEFLNHTAAPWCQCEHIRFTAASFIGSKRCDRTQIHDTLHRPAARVRATAEEGGLSLRDTYF